MKLDQKQEIVYGVHPVLELLKAKKRKIYAIYTTKPEPKVWSQFAKLLPSYIKINHVSKEMLNKLADSTDHQGIVAVAAPLQIRKKAFNPQKEKFLIMLDGLQDSRNLGAILRSAYCAGVDGVIITQKSTAPLNSSTLKASAGLAEYLEIYLAPTAKAAVDELKADGYSIFLATAPQTDVPIKNPMDMKFATPLCLVIGSEGTGISKNIINSGEQITLPQKSSDISYNASVAAGILLFIISTKNKII